MPQASNKPDRQRPREFCFWQNAAAKNKQYDRHYHETAQKGETMYNHDFSIQEVNAYYGRKGGMRTSNVSNYANAGSFASLIRRAAAQRSAGATPEGAAVAQTGSAVATGTSSRVQGATTAHVHSNSGKKAPDSTAAAPTTAQANGNVCCEQCHQTNQLMLQMMAKNLYTQSSLGYPLTGLNTWSAYQNMAGMLGNSLFS